MTDLQQTREVATAVQKARETRKRLVQAGASVGEVQLLAAIFDLHERLTRLATQPQRRAKRNAGD